MADRPNASRFAPLLLVAVAATVACNAAEVRAADDGGRFTITDDLAPVEISESTTIFVDGKLLARFHLDAGSPSHVVEGAVADPAGTHRYALCGEITVRRPNGGRETHEVDSGGTISDVAGRRYQALGAADFTFFYLADPLPGRALSVPERGHAPPCQVPVS